VWRVPAVSGAFGFELPIKQLSNERNLSSVSLGEVFRLATDNPESGDDVKS
jgi:hypothetical protein